MFRTKLDVDKHVQEVFRKLRNENERNLRSYNIAKLYYGVGAYEIARRYVSSYLSVRDNSPDGHRLLAQIYEKLGVKERALAEFKSSLELDGKQPELVLKVCELLVDLDMPVDKEGARYWCERADTLYPHHPAVFQLKEHLCAAHGSNDSAELEALIAAEVRSRPRDVNLRVRLLKLYLDTGRACAAYQQAVDVEYQFMFVNEQTWYDCLVNIMQEYRKSASAGQGGATVDWQFHMHYVWCAERSVWLYIQEQLPGSRMQLVDCVQALFRLDQALDEATLQVAPPSERELYKQFLCHMRAQLCLHLATFIFKRTNKELGNWKDACSMAAPLLLQAMVPPLDLHAMWLHTLPEVRKKMAERCNLEAAFRCSQAGHVLLSMTADNVSRFLEKVNQFCSGNWRERIFKRIFLSRDHQQAMCTSHFMRHAWFANVSTQVPTRNMLRSYDERSQRLQPAGLHYLVWLGLHDGKAAPRALGPDFSCHVFPKLPLSCANLGDTSPATLNKLDVDAFLYAAVFCCAAILEEQQAAGLYSSERPVVLPACIMPQLCSVEQAKWWTTAYQLYTQEVFSGDSRQVVKRGIEVVRVSGNHGLDKRLIVQLARIFADRAMCLSAQTDGMADVSPVEERASLYWDAALPMLERLQRNQSVRAPYCSLFEYRGKELSAAEVNSLVEEGRLFLACRLMKQDRLEEALQAFQQLKSPYATFHQASIYRRLATDELNGCRSDEITSEMRSRHVVLLVKARDALYLTYDRLRSPGTDPKHPLNAQLSALIHDVESELGSIDPELSNDVRNDIDRYSEESAPSMPSIAENMNIFQGSPANWQNSSSFAHLTQRARNSLGRHGYSQQRGAVNRLDDTDAGTDHAPYRTEARPSPERLDAQIRHMVHSRDAVVQSVLDKTKIVMESNEAIMQQLKENATCMQELKREVVEVRRELQELKKDMKSRKSTSSAHLNADLAQDDNDEGLYLFHDDYQEDLVAAAGGRQYRSFHTPHPTYPVMFPPAEPQPPMISTYFPRMEPHVVYPAPPLSTPAGYYAPSALPFSEGQQLPDFRGGPPPAPPAAFVQPKPVPTAPVNVVITSSDTLPTCAPAVQPTLSVTIPPRHRSTSATAAPAAPVPHAFQISLPAQPPPPQPSVLDKDAIIPLSKEQLLSSVPSPTYSAVSPSKDRRQRKQSEESEEEDDQQHQEEHEPSFEPVIPLPAEVELTTGEEAETLVFQTRAKLFRFVDKEWKERGVGQLKLLFDAATKKGRVLMRREQVLKVCANHLVTPDVQLTAMKDRAWMWAANDFADEEVRLEKLCARFKTMEDAQKFHAAFQKLKGMVAVSPMRRNEDVSLGPVASEKKLVPAATDGRNRSTPPAASESTTKAGASKPILTPAKFTVGGFSFTSVPNFKSDNKTDDSKNSTKARDASLESEKKNPMSGFTFFPLSKTSSNHSAAFSSSDENKNVSVGQNTESKSDSSSAMNGAAQLESSFNSFAQLAGGSSQFGTKADDTFAGWQGVGAPVFGGTTRAKDEDRVEDFVPTAEFQPVVPLPELVEVKTGEEEQDVLYQQRAKLLRFDAEQKQWKERGIGQMKVLRDVATGRIRLLMRREQVLKVCCNHHLTKDMKFNSLSTSDKAWTWYAQDYSEGELQAELFAVKFKTVEQAQAFKAVIDKAQSEMDSRRPRDSIGSDLDSSQVASPERDGASKHSAIWKCECLFPNSEQSRQCRSCKEKRPSESKDHLFASFGNSQGKLSEICKPKEGSWNCDACYLINDSDKLQCVACGAKKPAAKNPASKNPSDDNKLADLLKAKNGTWCCDSCSLLNGAGKDKCIACGGKKPAAAVAASKPAEEAKPLWQMFKPSADTWECKACYVRNNNSAATCVSCTSPNPSAPAVETKQHTRQPPAFMFGVPSQTYGFNVDSTFSSAQVGSTASGVEYTFGVQPEVKTSASAPLPAFSSLTPLNSDTSAEKPFMFGTTAQLPTFHFGTNTSDDVAKVEQDSSFMFGSDGKFSFRFSGVRAKGPAKSPKSPKSPGVEAGVSAEEDSASEPEDDGDHICFQPVIPLPDKVPLVTGEEDEAVVYCHRAKLYRFVEGEWKDRGVGDFKVLRHLTTGKVRLVMRRDQVLKLCLNHFLSPEINFTAKDDRAWMWFAPDFSEGQVTNEKFALRFKTKEIAEHFGQVINKIQVEMAALCSCTDASLAGSKPEDVAHSANEGESSKVATSFSFKVVDPSSTLLPADGQQGANETNGKVSVVRSLFGSSKASATTSSDTDDVEIVGEVVATHEDQERARQLMLPLNFYLYQQRPPCSGCRGCEHDSDHESGSEKQTECGSLPTTAVSSSTTTTFTSAFATPTLSRSQLDGAPSGGADDVRSGLPVPGPTQPASIFGKSSSFVFGTSETQTSATPVFGAASRPVATTTSHVFGGATGSPAFATVFGASTATVNVFGGAGTTRKSSDEPTALPAFSIPVLDARASASLFSEAAANKDVQTEDGLPRTPMVSFSSLAKSQTEAFVTGRPQNFAWQGAGSRVFGGSKADAEEGGSAGEDEEVGEEVGAPHDPHFEPVIALPDVVEVRTGEEDEEKVFGERGKLYRYEKDTKEWKERGVGEMKILRHPVNHTYRLLMRREQVYKVVCNHLITADLELKPMNFSEKALCWGALNYSDESEPQVEELAVRFKSQEIGVQFKETFDKCRAEVRRLQLSKSEAGAGAGCKERLSYERRPTLPSNSVLHQDAAVNNRSAEEEDEEEDNEEDDEEEEEDVEDEDDEEDDDEDEDSESGVMFEKEEVVLVRKDGGVPVELGPSHVSVVYDRLHQGHIYAMHEDQDQPLCHICIDDNCTLTVEGTVCEWTGLDTHAEHTSLLTFRADMMSDVDASDFRSAVDHCKIMLQDQKDYDATDDI